MSMNLNTNLASMNARRYLNETQDALSENIEHLSTGKRVNSADDDAAGLAVSETMQADIRSLAQAQRNANDAISMLETAEGGMSQAHDILNRMKELAVQANTDAISSTQRGNIDQEFQELKAELSDVALNTEFNNQKLLSGGNVSKSLQVGEAASDTLTLNIDQNFRASKGLGLSGSIVVSTKAGAVSAAEAVSDAISSVSTERARVGAQLQRLEDKIDNRLTERQSLEAANSRIRDVDVAKETAEFTQNQILSQVGTSNLTQANSIPQKALSLLQ